MKQFALPLPHGSKHPAQIVIGRANAHVAQALSSPGNWPFGTAVLTGPPRSGKTLLAAAFARRGQGEALDDAQLMDEAKVFHRWNRAREQGTSLLIVAGSPPWNIALPDLRSRLSAALQLEIGLPDDEMAGELIHSLAAERSLALGEGAAEYLVPRAGRSQAELEKLVDAIDRLSMERKTPPTLGIWRAALEAVIGPDEPRLI